MTVVASNFERQPFELYETEAWATRALLAHFPVGRHMCVWEAAAGNHKMVDVLREHGAGAVFSSDVQTYDRPHDLIFDFLDERLSPGHHYSAIITNPPYGKGNRLAAKFARLALARCSGLVALLLTAKFDSGKTRTDLFRDNARFAAKIVLLDRIKWFDGPDEGTEDHAWYVWAPTAFAGADPRLLYAGRECAASYDTKMLEIGRGDNEPNA